MKGKGLFKSIGLVIMGTMVTITLSRAQDSIVAAEDSVAEEVATEEVATEEAAVDDTAQVAAPVVGDAAMGRMYFDGSKPFINGGPACITCHNVTNDELFPGGLLAKDLTDVYERMGEGINGWLNAPPNGPMTASYQNHPLDDMERASLTAFFKLANEVKDEQTADNGNLLFYVGGGAGLLGILVLISLLWMKRKKQMVKKDIYARQNKAWDAKF